MNHFLPVAQVPESPNHSVVPEDCSAFSEHSLPQGVHILSRFYSYVSLNVSIHVVSEFLSHTMLVLRCIISNGSYPPSFKIYIIFTADKEKQRIL